MGAACAHLRERRGGTGLVDANEDYSDAGSFCASVVNDHDAPLPPSPTQPSTPAHPAVVGPCKPYVTPVLPNTVPTGAGVERLEPEMVYELLRQRARDGGGSCILVDVRDKDREAGIIEGSVHIPAIDPQAPLLSRIPELVRLFALEPLVVFTCQYSAHRGPTCANWYRAQADPRQRVAVMNGGFRGWEGRGLPVLGGAGLLASNLDSYAARAGERFAQMQQVTAAVVR
eukprot:TRINITY_DN3921_c0_g1_i1.p1 TRINITY_DN3921_c0_g1~~TRINITY_DN3921_c0_g1_i1.p1  ORF type:complete len:229 (+),score=57.18 TRINITY_DN3921_c0_g1_i1:149-835(+)